MTRTFTAAERKQAAQVLDRIAGDWDGGYERALRKAAAMLRQAAAGPKRCGTCRHFDAPRPSTGLCKGINTDGVLWPEVPADGSGFCHLHEAHK